MPDYLKKEVSEEEYQQRIAQKKVAGAFCGLASVGLYVVGYIVTHFLNQLPTLP